MLLSGVELEFEVLSEIFTVVAEQCIPENPEINGSIPNHHDIFTQLLISQGSVCKNEKGQASIKMEP